MANGSTQWLRGRNGPQQSSLCHVRVTRVVGPCTYRPFDFFDMVLSIKNVFDVDFVVCVKEKAKNKTF